jgi:hypothetical protein
LQGSPSSAAAHNGRIGDRADLPDPDLTWTLVQTQLFFIAAC